MMKIFIIMCFSIMTLFINTKQVENIYTGKNLLWKVYYDSHKTNVIIEISGIKYGYHDYLTKNESSNAEMIAVSNEGELFRKKGKLYYHSKLLDFEVQLKQKKYSETIDLCRKKLFEILAYQELSMLKDSLQVEYQFNWEVSTDYEYYRDNEQLPENYLPQYKKDFFSFIKKNKHE